MRLKVIELDDIKYVMACVPVGSNSLKFYWHNEAAKQSYVDILSWDIFQQRLKNLNARVKFPEDAVIKTLQTDYPLQAALETDLSSDGVLMLSCKYTMAESQVSLKWKWHLKPTGSSSSFYRHLLLDAVHKVDALRGLVTNLKSELCAKDREIAQYHMEGFQLRRTTIQTKVFDLNAFSDLNGELLNNAEAYNDLSKVFDHEPRSSPSSRDGSSASSSISSISERRSLSSGSSVRSRKRKALEINTNHLERKAKQRLQQTHVEFKNSQSSQETMTDYLTEFRTKKEQESEQKVKREVKEEVNEEVKEEVKEEVNEEVNEDVHEVNEEVEEEVMEEVMEEVRHELKQESEEEPDQEQEPGHGSNIETEAPTNIVLAEPDADISHQKGDILESDSSEQEEEEKPPGGNNDALTDSDQELNLIRSILAPWAIPKDE